MQKPSLRQTDLLESGVPLDWALCLVADSFSAYYSIILHLNKQENQSRNQHLKLMWKILFSIIRFNFLPPHPWVLWWALWQFFIPNMKNTTCLALTMPVPLDRKEKYNAFAITFKEHGNRQVICVWMNVKVLFYKADLNVSHCIYLRYLHKL